MILPVKQVLNTFRTK